MKIIQLILLLMTVNATLSYAHKDTTPDAERVSLRLDGEAAEALYKEMQCRKYIDHNNGESHKFCGNVHCWEYTFGFVRYACVIEISTLTKGTEAISNN